jgi:hypothetical protein
MNETMVAAALQDFSNVFGYLNFEDKSRRMGLLVEKVRVTSLNADKNLNFTDLGAYELKIRTSCSRIEVGLYIKALFRYTWNKADTILYLNQNGIP